jgi:putative membrane protein
MKIYFIPMLAALLFISCGENKNPEDSAEVADDRNEVKFDEAEKDAEFAVKATVAGLFEVKAAELALARTSNSDVRALAEMMKTDHSAANSELSALVKQKNISVPDTMDNEHSKKYQELADESVEDFDKAYVDMMVKGHKDVIDVFEKQEKNGTDQEMRSWATGKLPTLRHHLEMSETAQDKVKDNDKNK